MTQTAIDRKQTEREFHNRQRLVSDDPHVADTRWSRELESTIKNNPLWANMKYYAVERKSREAVLRWYEANTRDKTVLDYCCGNGDDGVLIAKNWARAVVGIDISDVSIENARRLAERSGVSNRVTHLVRDAENTGFDSNSFDVITEYGSLHHLDLDAAFSEMVRILKPGGQAICQEALAHNPAIHLYRKLTPRLRTPWEVGHILRKSSFDSVHRYFRHVDIKHYHFMSLAAVPFRNTALFEPLLGVLEAIDDVVLKLPGIRWYAWQTVFVLSDPIK